MPLSLENDLIPTSDILSWAFRSDSLQPSGNNVPIWVDSYDESNFLTTSDIRIIVKQLIRGLRQRGFQQGDVVCIHSLNTIWYPAIYLAIIGAGGIFVGSNPAYKSAELEHLFTTSHTKFLFVELSHIGHVGPVAVQAGITYGQIFVLDNESSSPSSRTLVAPDQSAECESWRQLLQYGEDDWVSFNDLNRCQSTPAVYLSSSGTTGMPKIVVVSHYAIIAQLSLTNYQVGDVPHEVRRLITLPLFHSFALPFPLLSLHRRETLYVMPRFSAKDCLSFIERYQITMMPIVPPIAKALFGDLQSRDTLAKLSSLTELISAGAPMDTETQKQLAARLSPSTRLVQLWGMSELGWVTAFRHPERDDLGGSVGRLLPGIEAKLVDGEGNDVSNKAREGEIWVRSPGAMMGYLNNVTATNEIAVPDGWLRTGDIGYCKEGKWYIVDRVKDIIKVRGWQVSPTEIEVCVSKHPRVADVAVIGIHDQISGELPLAFVVARDKDSSNMQGLAEDIQGYVARNLAAYKALGSVLIVGEIPRAPSGKILRKLLRAQMPHVVRRHSYPET